MITKQLNRPARGSARVQVRFALDELQQLKERSRAQGATLSATVRSLALASLDQQGAETAAYALAAVVAAEHVLRLLQTIVPDGASRSARLAAEAWTGGLERVSIARAELGGEAER
ncbi:MAG TPA: hypothetical protein VND98_06390 [Solirubrobacterales bacterium]|nr:hypothetical protein [Solirubrobacterales bacterium]